MQTRTYRTSNENLPKSAEITVFWQGSYYSCLAYSRNLPQFFVSDVDEDDVLCTMGQYDQKLLLFDSFKCWDEGCIVGQVSKEVIDQMPKLN